MSVTTLEPPNKEPCLPGFECEEATDAPPPVSDTLSTAVAQIRTLDLRKYLTVAGLTTVVLLVVVCAWKLIRPRTVVREIVREVKVEPNGVPLELLPDTADPSLWETVANMSGEIEGIELTFNRGLAHARNLDFKVCFDFCRGRDTVFARVSAGATSWVVEVNENRQIIKAYRSPRANKKPLKELFTRRANQ